MMVAPGRAASVGARFATTPAGNPSGKPGTPNPAAAAGIPGALAAGLAAKPAAPPAVRPPLVGVLVAGVDDEPQTDSGGENHARAGWDSKQSDGLAGIMISRSRAPLHDGRTHRGDVCRVAQKLEK
jgi:hypothetical protein